MLIALSVMLAVFAALVIFRQVHSRRQKAVAEIVAERLHVSDLEKYVDSEYSGRYVDAILCEELKSSMLDVYNRVCDVEKRSRILMSHNPSIAKFKDDFENLHSIVDAHKDRFKDDKLREHKAFFDTVLAYPLDDQQRRSIVSEEQNCLVVSSAGSGKTSSIVGKVEYLIQKKHIKPERILLISYTHKAAAELTERMPHPGLRGYTFHKLALDIISAQSKCKPSICDNTDAVFVRIYRELAHNADYRKCLVEYFADYSDLMELDEDEKSKNVRRLQLGESTDRRYCALFPDMDGNEVHVRSGEEKKICFLLTSLGVDFRYEEPYEHQVADERHVQYRPDFSIHYMDSGKPCRLYLEHFGVDEHGMVPTWFAKDRGLTYEEANERYNDGITWKREVHKKFGTRLIELSSADFAYEKARQRLKRELVAAGVPIREVRSDELFDRILPENSMREKVFIRLTATFATLLKTSCRSMADVAADVAQRGDKRSRFIVGKVLEPVVVRYNEILRSEGKVDFTDLIVGATALCNANGGGNYDCIIVDEFQDISMDRYNFLLALRRGNPQAQLYCVGDDWQSIYRFSGSDMNLFCHFDQYFGKTDLNKIETTYRFGNPLVEKSAAFIQRNPAQIRKNIHPFSSDAKTEIVFREYSRGDAVGALERIVTEIPLGKSVFLLGRYTYDDYLLAKNFRQRRSGNSLFYTICGREVEFLTMHRSKGLEADYVVLLNCNNGSFGFPSTIADDPVLGFVMSDSDGYLFGEERRLFYVAMTRAKVRTIVMYDKSKPSVFVLECISPERLADKPIEPHPNAGNRWTRADDRKLYKLYCGGMGFREISQKMGRSQTAIIMRLEKLGLIDARKPVRKF